jgi:hypothetical protein
MLSEKGPFSGQEALAITLSAAATPEAGIFQIRRGRFRISSTRVFENPLGETRGIFPGNFPGEVGGSFPISGRKYLVVSVTGPHLSWRELIRRTVNELRIIWWEVFGLVGINYIRDGGFQVQFRWLTEDREKLGKLTCGQWAGKLLG